MSEPRLFLKALETLNERSLVPTTLSQPDTVADAQSTFEHEQNQLDMLKRDRLPPSMYAMELEVRDHPVELTHRIVLTNMKLSRWLLPTFCVSTLIVAPLARLFGSGFLSPATYPIICFVCGLVAYQRFTATGSLGAAARAFVVPQVVTIFIEWAFSPGINPWWTVVPVATAIAGVGYLADQVNSHYVQWITANLTLTREAVEHRRRLWDLRFNWRALSKEIASLRIDCDVLEARGEAAKAENLRRSASELIELREYPLGFLALLYTGILLFLGAPGLVLLASAFGISVTLAFRRPLATMKLRRLIVEATVNSFVSWFSWDTQQHWVHSPGMFRDGLYSRYRRVTQTVLCFVVLQIAFVPPIQFWGDGEMLTAKWLWSSAYQFFGNLFLPALLLFCALIATGARPLWMHLEAIEFAEVSDEISVQ